MAGNIKLNYSAATSALTVTNLHSLASSQTYIGGWGSGSITNTSNLNVDYLIGGTFVTASANRQATGYINIYVVGALGDTPVWPTVASGTAGAEGAITFTDTSRLNSVTRLHTSIFVGESGNATTYNFPMTGIARLFGGTCPTHFFIYVAQNVTTTTTAGLASSTNAIYSTPVMLQYT